MILVFVLLLLPALHAMPSGLTFDPCRTDARCIAPRVCRTGFVDSTEPCPAAGDNCFCLADKFSSCKNSANCPAGEVCAFFTSSVPPTMFCASEDAVDSFSTLVTKDENLAQRSPEPQDEKPQGQMGTPADVQSIPEPLCVDAEALTNADVQMVYRKHFYAKVLCDSERSCATAAHMVVWRGVAMMMRSYCQRVQCEETALHVNSPRYKKKVRIQSRTEGLQFTAFAARYGTKAEELAIGVAVRLGL